MKKNNKKFRVISLFSGAGGMDLGFINAGFDIVWANDFFKEAVESYKKNISEDIVFPAVEFSVIYNGKVLHIITIFDDSDEEKVKTIQSFIYDDKSNKAKYDNLNLNAFTEGKYLEILKEIGLNVVMIAHQKESLSSSQTRTHDVKSLGDEKFDELVFLDYFESFEFKSKNQP